MPNKFWGGGEFLTLCLVRLNLKNVTPNMTSSNLTNIFILESHFPSNVMNFAKMAAFVS